MECASSASAASSAQASSIVQTWTGFPTKRRRTLPELLAVRQMVGKPSANRIGGLPRRGVPFDMLASRSAWNPRRMQNMILVVGPNTPASLLMGPGGAAPSFSASSSSSAAASEAAGGNDDDSDNPESKEEDADEMGEGSQPRPAASGPRRSRWTRRRASEDNDSHGDGAEDDHDENQEDQSDDDDEDEDGTHQILNRQALENALLDYLHPGSDMSEDDDEEYEDNNTGVLKPVPSMRHGGCINTAAWMDCGWSISAAGMSREATVTEECPTQLVTSGDDLLIKIWDVSHAMGRTSPLAGGYSTICPFSAPECAQDADSLRSKWRRYYSKTHSDEISGSVLPLATIASGHYNNVFHVTPLKGRPGKIATCAADGYLRLSDLESKRSTVIISPEYEDEIGLLSAGLMRLRPPMCFSHHFLSQNTGLLCSERGLRRFDIRIPPREQATRNVLGGLFRGCKACAIWSSSKSTTSLEEGDSAYVFAGGSSPEVALLDLRMTDGTSSKVVQKYCPRGLSLADMVSVSGLDLSRDGQELLVSYESDQIYTFPVFPSSTSSAGPTADEIGKLIEAGERKVLPELACYGGHLNRYTFLKNAKYAGPRDEYVCTGSDSGRAWIYEKCSGAVVSFLNADHSTCNGVIPHPTLPFFITYGIDSTAKLWRATIPVDPEVDDSAVGRRKCARALKYEMSPVVRDWDEIQAHLRKLDCDELKEVADLLPDQVPSGKDMHYRGRFGCSMRESAGGSCLGNDLHNLPAILLKNYFDCVRGILVDDAPVESDLKSLQHRISLIRLKHQADRLGLAWNPSLPWQLEPPKTSDANEGITAHPADLVVHPADLVPDYPSDWIPYDPEMTKNPWDFKNYFNRIEYEGFHTERYSQFMCDEKVTAPLCLHEPSGQQDNTPADPGAEDDEKSEKRMVSSSDDGEVPATDVDPGRNCAETVYNNLFETMKLLKDAGNQALQDGNLDLAARRYDKAIRYGAVASMSFPSGTLDFAGGRKARLKESGGYHLEWSPLIRLLIVTRLNLALLFLKPHFSERMHAIEQALMALHDLEPFCAKKGKIMKGSKLDQVHRDDEPEDTYLDAMALQAKAYFRLGSAQYELGEWSDAVASYEKSVCSTQKANAKPDNLVLRRLSEAKRENRRKGKRHRKKFKFAFSANETKNEPTAKSGSDG